MARGGMYDQLGGGFARYSVDADWVVPHFEKMLYDNALLARVYAHWWRLTGSALARRVAAETCAWMIAELRTPRAASPPPSTRTATARRASSTPGHRRSSARCSGATTGLTRPAPSASPTRGHLRARHVGAPAPRRPGRTRSASPGSARRCWPPGSSASARPGTTRWSPRGTGWRSRALAETGLLLERPEFTEAARGAAELIARIHLAGGRPGPDVARRGRRSQRGRAGGLRLRGRGVPGPFRGHRGSPLGALAGQLLETALERFGDPSGGFYDTADDGESLIYRPADPADGPSPSGTFAVAGALLSYSALTGSAEHRAAVAGALRPLPAVASRYPRAAGWGLAVAEAMISGPAEIAIVGPPGDDRTGTLQRTALLAAPPGAVLAVGPRRRADGDGADGDSADGEDAAVAVAIPLLAGRGLVGGAPGRLRLPELHLPLPVTDPEQLRAELSPAG